MKSRGFVEEEVVERRDRYEFGEFEVDDSIFGGDFSLYREILSWKTSVFPEMLSFYLGFGGYLGILNLSYFLGFWVCYSVGIKETKERV